MSAESSGDRSGSLLWVVLDGHSVPAPVSGSGNAVQAGIHPDGVLVHAWSGEGAPGVPAPVLVGGARRRDGLLGRLRRPAPEGLAVEELLDSADAADLAVRPSDAAVALSVVGSAREAGHLDHLWILTSDLDVLREVRDDSPATKLLHECDPAEQPGGPERHAASLREATIEGVMVPHNRVSGGLVALMHRFGRLVGASGAEYARMVRNCVASGADIVCGPSVAVLEDGLDLLQRRSAP